MKYIHTFLAIALLFGHSNNNIRAQESPFIGEWTGIWTCRHLYNETQSIEDFSCKMTVQISEKNDRFIVRIKESANRGSQNEVYYHNPAIEIKHIGNSLQLFSREQIITYSDKYSMRRDYMVFTLSDSGVLVLTGRTGWFNAVTREWEYKESQPMNYFNPPVYSDNPIYRIELFKDSDDW